MEHAVHQLCRQPDGASTASSRWLLLFWFRRERGPLLRCDACNERAGWIRFDDYRPPVQLFGLGGLEKRQRQARIYQNYLQDQQDYGVRSYCSKGYCLTCAAQQLERVLPNQLQVGEQVVEALQDKNRSGATVIADMELQSVVLVVTRARTLAKLWREVDQAAQ
jgi:hypothetical protein